MNKERTFVRAGETVSRQCLEPLVNGREPVGTVSNVCGRCDGGRVL